MGSTPNPKPHNFSGWFSESLLGRDISEFQMSGSWVHGHHKNGPSVSLPGNIYLYFLQASEGQTVLISVTTAVRQRAGVCGASANCLRQGGEACLCRYQVNSRSSGGSCSPEPREWVSSKNGDTQFFLTKPVLLWDTGVRIFRKAKGGDCIWGAAVFLKHRAWVVISAVDLSLLG